MFDFVRKYTKVIAIPLFLLIILAFVLVGVDGYKGFNQGGETVAKVGGKKITQEEWDFAHKQEVDRLRASMPELDAKLLDSPEARYVTLERLVRDRVMAQAVESAHLTTSDARLARELQQNPTIASLRKADGTLDKDRYAQLASSQGLTPAGFEARVRSDLTLRQVESSIVGTAIASNAQADVSLNAFFERRDIQIANFNAKDYAAKVNPSDADIDAFYQDNQSLFQAPESADIEYAVLDLDAIKKGISVNEADLKTYYEQNASRLGGKEERRASHILISAAKDAPAAEREKAKERARALLAQARKAPDSFAELARKNSQDPGSAAKGGDLDYFVPGAMVKPFEDAAFAMKKGDISDVVESDFGFHIIKVTDIKAAKVPSFAELRSGLELELKTQQAQRKYAEVAEAFTNGVYEQSDSLKPVADKLKIEVRTSTGLMRTASPAANGVLANPKFLAAVFSADSVEKKRNTEAVELGANQLAAARITNYKQARTLPLDDVRADVKMRLIVSRAAELAKKDGSDKLEAWKTNAAGATLAASEIATREPGQKVQGAVLDAVLRADASKLPAWVGVDLASQGYAVVRINKVLPRNAPQENVAKQERSQYTQWLAAAENQAYYELLKERFKVQIKVAKPEGIKPESASATQ